jgi:hypothetical protein
LKYLIGIIVLVNLILALSGERIMEKTISLPTNNLNTWKIIRELKEYKKYDNYEIEKEGDFIENNSVKYIIKKDEKIENITSVKVTYVDETKELGLTGGIPGILFYQQDFSLFEEGARTILRIKVKETGLLVWIQNLTTWDPTLPLLNTNIIKEETLKRFPPLP